MAVVICTASENIDSHGHSLRNSCTERCVMFGNHQDLEILQLVKTRHPNTTMISIRNISEQFRIMLEEGTRVAQCVR
jgi:hypothetical protein